MDWKTFQLDIGSTGSWVRLVQVLLEQAGKTVNGTLVAHGIFDATTKQAVEDFQAEKAAEDRYDGDVDGRVGPMTIGLLLEDANMDEAGAKAALEPWTKFVDSETGAVTVIFPEPEPMYEDNLNVD